MIPGAARLAQVEAERLEQSGAERKAGLKGTQGDEANASRRSDRRPVSATRRLLSPRLESIKRKVTAKQRQRTQDNDHERNKHGNIHRQG